MKAAGTGVTTRFGQRLGLLVMIGCDALDAL